MINKYAKNEETGWCR